MLRCGLDLVLSLSYSRPLLPTNVLSPVPALSDFAISMSDYLTPSLEHNNMPIYNIATDHPGPPWFHWQEGGGYPTYQVLHQGEVIQCPYI